MKLSLNIKQDSFGFSNTEIQMFAQDAGWTMLADARYFGDAIFVRDGHDLLLRLNDGSVTLNNSVCIRSVYGGAGGGNFHCNDDNDTLYGENDAITALTNFQKDNRDSGRLAALELI